MAIRNVQLLEESVTTGKIAPDTVIPADVDETLAYNFSNTTGTWAGRTTGSFTGLLDGSKWTAGTIIVEALNVSSTSGTFAGVYTGVANSTNTGSTIGNIGLDKIPKTDTANNFSSASGTFAGVATGAIKGTLDGSHWTAGTAIVEALNVSSASGTFAGVYTGVANSTNTGSTIGNIGLDKIPKTDTANNFSSASGTFAGAYTGIANSTNTGSTIGNIGLDKIPKTDTANNFSSASGTWAGVATGAIKGTLDGSHWTAGTAIVEALNVSSASGTFAGAYTGIANSTNTGSTIGNIGLDKIPKTDTANNFSSASGTFAGVATGAIKGTLDGSHWTAGTAIVEALDISSASGTFSGIIDGPTIGAATSTLYGDGSNISGILAISLAGGTIGGGTVDASYAYNWTSISSTYTMITIDSSTVINVLDILGYAVDNEPLTHISNLATDSSEALFVESTSSVGIHLSCAATALYIEGAATGIVTDTPCDFSDTTSTFGKVNASLEVQGLNLNVTSTSGFNFNWGSSFSGVPIVSYAKIGASTIAMPVMIIADLAGGTVTTSLTGTVNVIGVYGY